MIFASEYQHYFLYNRLGHLSFSLQECAKLEMHDSYWSNCDPMFMSQDSLFQKMKTT